MASGKLVKASSLPEIEYITTGIEELDAVVRFPKGRIVEIFGKQSVGKTTMTMLTIAGMTRSNLKTLFIDVENTFNKDWATKMGVNLDKLMVSDEVIIEEIVAIVRENQAKFDAIVIDSLAAMVPRGEYDPKAKSGEAFMGLKARLINQFMRMITHPLSQSGCCLIFINQLRDTMELYGKKAETPGGNGLKYHASLRLELKTTSTDRIMKGTEQLGHWVTVRVEKSKVSQPRQTARFKVLY